MIRILASLVLALLLALPATAQVLDGRDRDKPIEIQADNLQVDRDARVAVFTGNVDARQGRMTLKADQLRVHYREGGDAGASGGNISLIEAIGNVEVSTETERATGAAGAYDVDKGIITLQGGVRLYGKQSVLTGNQVVMDLNSGQSRLGGQGRVTATFDPTKSGN
ncbi:MAG: lipopolysaccharide transport periplasmic protein LptA [Pseudomonadota bacterium]|nr:lipopolysaccharide transport periplasmic protein LptA [Pseudomonadota bacterium]